jgi:hypothetical protein
MMSLFGKKEHPISGQLEIDLILSAQKAVYKAALKILEIRLEDKPKIAQHPCVQWQGKMKVTRPSGCTHVAGVIIERPDPIDNGFILFFTSENTAEMIAGSLGIRPGADGQGLYQACEIFLKQVIEFFRESLQKLGYEDLALPEPQSFPQKDFLVDYFRISRYCLTFTHKDERFLNVDLGIGPLKKIASS